MKSMNVVQNEKLLRPPTKQDDAKPPGRLAAAAAAAAPPPPAPPPPLTKYHFEFDKNLRTQRRSASCWKSSARSPNRRDSGRGRASTSSFLADGSSRNCISRSGTRSTTAAISSSAFETASNILAITTGRGEARTEVGMAALDTRCSCLILCQISDSQTYANALSKLHLFDPMEVLMPDTMCERTAGRSVLYCSIVCKFSYLRVTPISRIHFNDANGLERIRTLCAAEYSSVELFVKEKYYALAAAAALLKYVEYAQRIVYAPKSMKIEFQGSPNATVIDLESARSLELVRSQCGQRNVSLLGILDACSTPMGRKLLRASILQPPCQESIILERQSSVAELVSDRSLRDLLQPIVRRLHGADRLVALSTTPVLLENTVQCAEQNLNYALLLKNLLDVVPELEAILSAGESDVLRRIRRNLQNPRFRSMKEKILERIHPDARSVTGYTSSNMQRCFAIKAGINDLLDVARQTYCELIDDMKSMVENLACKYELTLSLGCNASLGYHIQAVFPRDRNSDTFDPPAEFVEVRKGRRVCTMTTGTLSTLSQQCKIASEELHLMSNVLLSDLLQEIRGYIGCLFQLSADVAELDLIISLARVSSIQTYVRPTFGRKLELHDSRHPVLEAFGFDNPVPNDVNASIPWNFYVITGPNMSGKSTYLKQIVLLHIMAQIGCFVPAKKATFRLTDLIFCKIAVRDDIECNASTFTLEVVEWLNEASLNPSENVKVTNLCKVQEILLNKEQQLLPLYLDEVLQFSLDRNADVRKTVTGFIEEAGVKQPDIIPRVVQILLRLVSDESSAVAKRALRASGRILRAALKWIASAITVTPEMEIAWSQLGALKIQIINMIDSDNDGIRTQAVKFLEGVVLIQTYPDPDSPKKPDDFSLEDIPLTLKIARRRKLEEEANDVMDLLIKFHGSPHVSSVNLMTCMGSLALISKTRPQFMPCVMQALQRLQHDLPPTLSDSQVTSVQKQLKLTLLGLMKHPASIEFASTIAKQLTQLGAKEQEIIKAYPKPEDIRRMKKRQQEAAAASAAKRVKIETPLVPDEPEIISSPAPVSKLPELMELSESFIAERLSVEIATDLVMDSMAWVPDTMTTIFQREYQPTSTTDINIQRQTIAKLLATQIKQAKAKKKKDAKDEDAVMEDLIKNPTISVAEAKRERKREKDREKEKEAKASLEAHEKSLAKARNRLKALKLSEVTKPLSKEIKEKMLLMAVNRILLAEKTAVFGGVAAIRSKILTTLAATFNPYVKEAVLRYITDDTRNRLDLALGWLYEEYALLQGFQRRTSLCTKPQEAPHQAYNFLLCTLVSAIDLVQGKDRDTLLSRLYLEAPLITEDAVEALKMVSSDETRGLAPLQLLKEMVIRRPTKQLVFLNVLLCHTGHENNTIREAAIQLVCQLYSRPELSKLIEEYAVLYLGFLRLHTPPEIVFGQDRGRPQVETQWTESTTRACLGLYLALLSEHQDLIHELARVYTSMSADVKRMVLRLVEGPVRSLGMGSPQLLALVENCPKGGETLVTRIIHILTEKSAPSVELVARVRELYQTRVSDVRFLIPVLNGLTKKEVIAALPKLIKLNPVVVKEVFNRLLGTHNNESGVPHTSPITPAELLIALHNIDPSKAELKTIIKATSLCFAEKQVYTQETVAVVMQHLMEMTPLPTLLMRTVIQSLALYPRLSGFVMNILQRLILKQVWKQPKVWEGFVKCCERTQPQSFAVILQLPPAQLAEALRMASNLRTPLLAHVEAFAENQKAHIPQSIMDVIQGKSPCDMHDEFDIAPPGDYQIEQKPDTMETDVSEPAPPGLD